MTLALLLTAVTGAWADNTETVNITAATVNGTNVTVTATGYNSDPGALISDAGALITYKGATIVVTSKDGSNFEQLVLNIKYNEINAGDVKASKGTCTVDGKKITVTGINASSVTFRNDDSSISISSVEVTFAEAPITVAWNASTKTGTFAMPGSDVVLTPIYAKAAAFATTGTGSEAKTLLPEAAEGVIAGTDASLIAEGTGIVAFAGESTEATQGTLMYAIGTSATEAPAPDAFSATAPTAENVADDGADVYVWYYIQGADAPEGEAATLDNTFADTEPACLTVQVLSNKFDITFNAANANTIEAGKATVTVGGEAATVTEGKLQGVKMGSEVKLKAKRGYVIEKVEAKKTAALLTLSVCGETIYYVEGETWAEAIQNHATENQGWRIDSYGVGHDNFEFLMQNDEFVPGSAKIDPNASYSNADVL